MMADARSLLLSSVVALGALACVSCAGCANSLDARALDRVCSTPLSEGPACEIRGLVPNRSGVTADSLGLDFVDGALVIHLAALPEAHAPDPFDIQALAVAKRPGEPLEVEVSWGSCAQGCPASPPLATTPLTTEHAWTRVASGVRGAERGAVIPYDARLTITGVQIELVDLRFVLTP